MKKSPTSGVFGVLLGHLKTVLSRMNPHRWKSNSNNFGNEPNQIEKTMKHRYVRVWQPAEDDVNKLIRSYNDCGYRLVSHSYYRDDNDKLIISFIFERECDHNCEQCKKPFENNEED